MSNIEVEAKTALHKLKRRGLPYKYDLNAYRGCSHGCSYCYARRSHAHLNGAFDLDINVKTNIAECLDKELSSPSWQGEIINLGGVCDSYQPLEEQYRLMPEVLKVLIKHKNPVIISTKSALILRDIELIDQLASLTYVNVALCITSASASLASKVEPGASPPTGRFTALKELANTKAFTGLHVMPILPLIADDTVTLETLVSWADQAKVSYMLTGMLYLTGGIKKRYLAFVKEHYPECYTSYLQLYPKGGADKTYKAKIHNQLAKLRSEYGVNNSYAKFIPQELKIKR